MKLFKFRVKNYKSIVDSGDCYMTDNVTILAGKNESGKTSILEALEDFDFGTKIRVTAIPIKMPNEKPNITLTFIIRKDEINDVCEQLNLTDIPKLEKIEILKEYPDTYSFGPATVSELLASDWNSKTIIAGDISNYCSTVSTFVRAYPSITATQFVGGVENIHEHKSKLVSLKTTLINNPGLIPVVEKRTELLTIIQEATSKMAEYESKVTLEKQFLSEVLKTIVPNFILFNSFEDVFPNKIPLASLEADPWMKDLEVISDLKISSIKTGLDRDKKRHKTALNIKLNDHYKKFWTQGESNLSVDWDSQNLFFYIEEDGWPYEPNLRSKGRQWHLAFYIKVTARAKENVLNIILIDEPGLFLHATAQRDILKNLEEAAKETQVIFSTHSPYLLEDTKLNRIRLVFKNEKGTRIENKVHALADKETLTPILTAIGCNIPKGIDNVQRENNVVVEGISDVYYLEAFKRLYKHSDINFIFGGGANMPIIGTILNGWGCKIKYLYDNDQGKKDAEKNLINSWHINRRDIFAISDSEGAIEDVFAAEDFKKYILRDESISIVGKNSEHLKKNKKEKALLAKQFLELTESGPITLSAKTDANVKKVLSNILAHFKGKKEGA